jgi:hypothetical protein
LGCGKKAKIPPIFKKCYFSKHIPILELSPSPGRLGIRLPFPTTGPRASLALLCVVIRKDNLPLVIYRSWGPLPIGPPGEQGLYGARLAEAPDSGYSAFWPRLPRGRCGRVRGHRDRVEYVSLSSSMAVDFDCIYQAYRHRCTHFACGWPATRQMQRRHLGGRTAFSPFIRRLWAITATVTGAPIGASSIFHTLRRDRGRSVLHRLFWPAGKFCSLSG